MTLSTCTLICNRFYKEWLGVIRYNPWTTTQKQGRRVNKQKLQDCERGERERKKKNSVWVTNSMWEKLCLWVWMGWMAKLKQVEKISRWRIGKETEEIKRKRKNGVSEKNEYKTHNQAQASSAQFSPAQFAVSSMLARLQPTGRPDRELIKHSGKRWRAKVSIIHDLCPPAHCPRHHRWPHCCPLNPHVSHRVLCWITAPLCLSGVNLLLLLSCPYPINANISRHNTRDN